MIECLFVPSADDPFVVFLYLIYTIEDLIILLFPGEHYLAQWNHTRLHHGSSLLGEGIYHWEYLLHNILHIQGSVRASDTLRSSGYFESALVPSPKASTEAKGYPTFFEEKPEDGMQKVERLKLHYTHVNRSCDCIFDCRAAPSGCYSTAYGVQHFFWVFELWCSQYFDTVY